MQERTEQVRIIDERGFPRNFGWARRPLFQYAQQDLLAPARRITSSDRYIIFGDHHLLLTETLDGGWLGYVGVTIVDFHKKKRATFSSLSPLSMGSLHMPDSSEKGVLKIQKKQFTLDYAAMDGEVKILKMDIPKFSHNRGLRGAIVLTPPPGAESIVTAAPWRRDRNAFIYTRRSPWYRGEGIMQFGGQELLFTRDRTWGIFDWNRGVRPSQDLRYWAAGCGNSGGKQVSFSIGYGSADYSQGTENGFFIDGKLIKLEQVTFHINPRRWLDPWRFVSSDRRLEMTFSPDMERNERQRFFFFSHSRRQIFGLFSGAFKMENGETIIFEQVQGFAERKKTRN
jgi:hypothetical protein